MSEARIAPASPARKPDPTRRSVRVDGLIDRGREAALALLGVAVVAAGSGAVALKVFHQASLLKWALTLAAPLLLGLLLTARRPALLAAGLMIVTLPFEPYVATLHGQPVSIVLITTTMAVAVVAIERRREVGMEGTSSAFGAAAPFLLVLLLIPTFLGTGVSHELGYLLTFAIVVWVCRRAASGYPDGRRVLALLFVGSAALQGALAFVQHATGRATSLYGGAGSHTYSSQTYFFSYGSAARTTGAFFDPISLGNVLAMALPLAVVLALTLEVPARQRLLAGVCTAPLLAGLAVSLSRASWLAAVAGVGVLCLVSRGVARRRIVVATFTLLLVAVVVITPLYGATIKTRFESIFHPTAANVRTAAGDRGREELWATAESVFEHHPVTGVGFGHLAAYLEDRVSGTGPQTQAQSTYLQYLGEGGLLGGAAIVVFYGAVAVDLARHRAADPLVAGLAGAFAACAVTWVTDYTVRYVAVASCLAVLVGLAASHRSDSSREIVLR